MTTWGPTENTCRIGVDWHGLGAITKDTASVTVGADVRWYSGVAVTDTTNVTRWDWVGYGSDPDGADPDALKLTAFTGMQYFKSVTRPLSLIYGASQDVTLNVWVSPLEYIGDDQLDVSATITVPARPFQLPHAPTGVGVTKNSDTSHTVAWTGDYTAPSGGYPWAGVYVDRWDNVEDGWYRVASLGWDATSYTDTTTQADRTYRYSVYSHNTSGQSAHVDTALTYTTPTAHSSLSWAKASSDVVLSWVRESSLSLATEVEESAGGGAWTWKATVAAGTNTWTHSAPSTAVTHQYRVRPGNGGVMGAWTTSSVVQLLSPPLAPTGLAPSGITLDPVTMTITATWNHNPVDGTAQTQYEHRVKEGAGAYVSSGLITSTTNARVLSGLLRGKTYVHQVRTRGQHATWGPWGAEQSFTTGTPPQTGITYPTTADHGTSALTAVWTYYDADGSAHVQSEIRLSEAGQPPVFEATTYSLAYSIPVELENLTDYQFEARVKDSTGLWSSWASVEFLADFIPPTTPTIVGTFDPALGSTSLTITNPDADGITTVDPVHNTVWRKLDGGPWELVADAVPLNTTVIDQTPTTAGTNTYRVVAWSVTPTMAESVPLVIVAASPWLFVNGGPGFSTMARLKGGPAIQLAVGRTKVLHQFVGHDMPVEFTGRARTRAYALSGSVDGLGAGAAVWGSWQAWETIADLPAPLIYRDPLGRYERVSIGDVSIEHDATSRKAKISATLTVVAS